MEEPLRKTRSWSLRSELVHVGVAQKSHWSGEDESYEVLCAVFGRMSIVAIGVRNGGGKPK